MKKFQWAILHYLRKKSSATNRKSEWVWRCTKDIDTLQRVADRERAPMYVVGEATADKNLHSKVRRVL